MKIINAFTDCKVINWAGGTSTELFIYPSIGDFATRDFIFRISTATVELEESTFTFFEGITRHLMILDGTLEITHIDRYSKTLEPYQQDTFSGEWPTKAKGKVSDFNLMLKNGASGELVHIELDEGKKLSLSKNVDYSFLYVAEGLGLIDGVSLFSGDFFEIKENIKISGIENCELIQINVRLAN